MPAGRCGRTFRCAWHDLWQSVARTAIGADAAGRPSGTREDSTVARQRKRSSRKFLTATNVLAALALSGSVACAAVALGWLTFDDFPWSIAVSFHRWFALALAVAAAAIVLVAIAPHPIHRSNSFVAGVVSIACVGVAVGGWITSGGPIDATTVGEREANSLRVAAWNVQNHASPTDVAWLVGATHADIIVLSEQYFDARPPLHNMHLAGYQMLNDPGVAVTVLVSTGLGAYHVADVDRSGATSGVVVEPIDPESGSPRIVGVHITRQSPIGGGALWKRGLEWVAGQCSGTSTIAAGDFNSTVENLPDRGLGNCQLPTSRVTDTSATWPSSWPVYFGIRIDHAMATDDLEAVGSFTLDSRPEWSDHRPVVVDFAALS
jgi:hypothetical protein